MQQHSGVPGWFRATYIEVAIGCGWGYRVAREKLALALGSEVPDEVDTEVDALYALLIAGDRGAVWAWFKYRYPHFMAYVPTRRREQFLNGVFEIHERDGISI